MPKRIILVALFVSLLSLVFCVHALCAPPVPSIEGADSVYLFCEESGDAIVSKSGSGAIYPASTTKMMTGIVAIDLVGNKLDEKITLTSTMLASKFGTSMQLGVGEVVSYRDLLYATICGGFNDAATALAVASAGSLDAFVELMNEKAVALGATDTHYTNPTGWHDDAMVTTLHDTALIARAAAKNPLYLSISSAASYTVGKTNLSDEFIVRNRNGLIGSFYTAGYYNRHAKGLAAGMTDEGGYCLATSVEYDGLHFICIVMGGKKQGEVVTSYAIANELIDYAIYYYDELDLFELDDVICSFPLKFALSKGGEESFMLSCVATEDISLYTIHDKNSLSTLEVRPYLLGDELLAPVSKGEIVGAADIYIDGEWKATIDLAAATDVRANTFLTMMSCAKDFFVGRAFLISLACFPILFAIYYFTIVRSSQRKRAKELNFKKTY